MRAEPELNHWIIVRGTGRRESFFCFFVDHDRASWSSGKPWSCAKFKTKAEAEETITEIRKRNAIRRNPNADCKVPGCTDRPRRAV